MNCPTVAAGTPTAPRTADEALPLNSHLELAALPTAPGCARAHAKAILLEWGLRGMADTAELLVSELVTNSVQASERLKTRDDVAVVPVVRLWMASDRTMVVIRVWDGSDDMPIHHNAAPDEIGGRGLMIIDSLAADWGSYRLADGKVVWAVVADESQSGADDFRCRRHGGR
jgi:anti-sigma regulatory factor (Ser/Thr protein kinase)